MVNKPGPGGKVSVFGGNGAVGGSISFTTNNRCSVPLKLRLVLLAPNFVNSGSVRFTTGRSDAAAGAINMETGDRIDTAGGIAVLLSLLELAATLMGLL